MTLPASDFTPAGIQTRDQTPPGVAAVPVPVHQPPTFGRESLADQLAHFGYPSPPATVRFTIEGLLGAGSGGCVFAAHDQDLDRPVAIKLLTLEGASQAEAVRSFIDEARITAALDHPNVLPVHEIEMSTREQIFFTMKRLEGRSLGQAIESSSPDRRVPPLHDTNAVVTVFIGVCQALSLAHQRGIVHQDLKPDNILLGDFGEVLVCDWGSAVRLSDPEPRPLYGTPLYMSPEQARREPVDRRSDVYCIGATLYHALVLRPPSWHEDPDRFWADKRSGRLSELTTDERGRVPAPLLAIMLKTLAPEPAGRYRDAGELLEDLRAFQAGLAVAAVPESTWRRLVRWHHRHYRSIWSWTIATLIVITLGVKLGGERLKELARWGSPVESLDQIDPGWATRWTTLHGAFQVQDGALVTTGSEDRCMLVLDRNLHGSVAIEYDGEMQLGSAPCDISAVWARDVTRDEHTHAIIGLVDPYYCKVGAYDNTFTAIGRENNDFLTSSTFRATPGHVHHIRDEIVDNQITLSVDGRVLCRWEETFPFGGGYVGLVAWYPGKRFSHVRVYQRLPPAKVPVTAIGDASVQKGYWGLAAGQYAEVESAFPGTALAWDAQYKRGLCRWHDQTWEEATHAWIGLPAHLYQSRIDLDRIEHAIDTDAYDEAQAGLTALAASPDEQVHVRDALLWGRLATKLIKRGDATRMRSAWDVYDHCFAGTPALDATAGEVLDTLRLSSEVLARFPGQRHLCAVALMRLGRPEDVVDHYQDQRADHELAAFLTGRWDAMRRGTSLWQESLWFQGHADQLIADPTAGIDVRWRALLSLGRMTEVLADPHLNADHRAKALMLLGRVEEAAQEPSEEAIGALLQLQRFDQARSGTKDPIRINEVSLQQALRALAHGDHAGAARHLSELAPLDEHQIGYEWDESLLVPWLTDISGLTHGSFAATCDHWRHSQICQKRLSAAVRLLEGTDSDAVFLTQPLQFMVEPRLHLYKAVRAQLHHDAVLEAAEEEQWIASPRWKRSEKGWSALDLIVRCRLQSLGRPVPSDDR